MYTLPHSLRARFARTLSTLGLVAAACAGLTACQTAPDPVRNARTFDGDDGFMYQRGAWNAEYPDASRDGVYNGSILAYLSTPLDFWSDPRLTETQPGGGWAIYSFVLSDFRTDPTEMARWAVMNDPTMHPDSGQLLLLSEERRTMVNPEALRELDPGRRMQIIDYASLMNPGEVAQDGADLDNRATD